MHKIRLIKSLQISIWKGKKPKAVQSIQEHVCYTKKKIKQDFKESVKHKNITEGSYGDTESVLGSKTETAAIPLRGIFIPLATTMM